MFKSILYCSDSTADYSCSCLGPAPAIPRTGCRHGKPVFECSSKKWYRGKQWSTGTEPIDGSKQLSTVGKRVSGRIEKYPSIGSAVGCTKFIVGTTVSDPGIF